MSVGGLNHVRLVAERALSLMRQGGALAFTSYDLPGEDEEGNEVDYARIVREELNRALRRYGFKIVSVCWRCIDEDIYLIAPSDLPDENIEVLFHTLVNAYGYRGGLDRYTDLVEAYTNMSFDEVLAEVKKAWGL